MSLFFFLFLEWQKAKKNAEQETIEELCAEVYELEKQLQLSEMKIIAVGIKEYNLDFQIKQLKLRLETEKKETERVNTRIKILEDFFPSIKRILNKDYQWKTIKN